MTRELRIVGIASFITALGMGIRSNSSVLSLNSMIVFRPLFYCFFYNDNVSMRSSLPLHPMPVERAY